MRAARLVAVDLGGESGRVTAGTFDGSRLHLEDPYRFANVPVRLGATLYWDFLKIFQDLTHGLRLAGPAASVGVDAWGVDYGLLDRHGQLLGNPIHYRDARTAGTPRRLPREQIYLRTGIQFMEINTLNQLLVETHLESAERLLLIPDLVNHFLCGSSVSEWTNATTTQCFDPCAGDWARDMLADLGVPTRIFPDVVPPGTALGILDETFGAGTPQVIATASHDTASAVAGTPLDPSGSTAFISSGTWSLVGLEMPRPLINAAALAANVTNEGGVDGTTRLLRNVMGLWLLQEVRRALGNDSYDHLVALGKAAPAFTAFVDPDHPQFLRPGDLPSSIRAFCRATSQAAPEDPGTLVRVVLESLALKYAWVIRQLQDLTGRQVRSISVVGGGARNELLCQLTANATGVPVRAGPTETTTIGNLLVQAIALGELRSLAEARELVAHSFPPECYEPNADWSDVRERFERVLESGVKSA